MDTPGPIEPGEAYCRTCVHYAFNEDRAKDVSGQCRRNSPHPMVTKAGDEEEEYTVSWPTVHYTDWCGDWEYFEDDADEASEDVDDAPKKG